MADAPRFADPLLERLSRLDSGQVSDVLDEAGLPNHALSSQIAPVYAVARLVGRAACVRGEPIVTGQHAPKALPTEALEELIRPGSILVIATAGFLVAATVGGIVSRSLQQRGCAGLITDGVVRDVDEIRDLGFPIFAAGVSPLNASRRWRFVEADVALSLPGQTGASIVVQPGDLILGDRDGTVIVPEAIATQIIEDAEELRRIEGKIADDLRSGISRAEAFKRNSRFAHVRSGLSQIGLQ